MLVIDIYQHSFKQVKMKLLTFVTLLSVPLALAIKVQDNCARNNCYNAVWGSNVDDIIRAARGCQDYLTTTAVIYPV
jgi:hypothetical protein